MNVTPIRQNGDMTAVPLPLPLLTPAADAGA